MFPAYLFAGALGLNGELVPVFDLAPAPTEKETGAVEPQLARTFEPVCPGDAGAPIGGKFMVFKKAVFIGLWRSSAKATPAESISVQEAAAMET
jgi:hypothetical protein